MNTFHLEIVTPEEKIFEGRVQSVQVPGMMGSFQVLYNHAPIISTLGKGRLKFVDDKGESQFFQTEDGVIEVLNNRAIILVDKLGQVEAAAEA